MPKNRIAKHRRDSKRIRMIPSWFILFTVAFVITDVPFVAARKELQRRNQLRGKQVRRSAVSDESIPRRRTKSERGKKSYSYEMVQSSPAQTQSSEPEIEAEEGTQSMTLMNGFQKLTRIVGGANVEEPSRYPWFTRVVGTTEEHSGVDACGGALIAKDLVLTAAHCTDPTKVYPSRHNLNIPANEKIDVAGFVRHPEHRTTAYSVDFDIMIIHLAEPSTAVPIRLNFDDEYPVTPNESLSMLGFGSTIGGPETGTANPPVETARILQTAETLYVPFETCAVAEDPDTGVKYGVSTSATAVSPHWFCTTGPDTTTGMKASTCYGDSGGPILKENYFDDNANGATNDLLLAVISGTSGYCGNPHLPLWNQRVSYHKEWIIENGCALSRDPPAEWNCEGLNLNSLGGFVPEDNNIYVSLPATEDPTAAPTRAPTDAPTTKAPIATPTSPSPTLTPTTTAPTPVPTSRLTTQRPNPFPVPFLDPDGEPVTEEPTVSLHVTEDPTAAPTRAPTDAPTTAPTDAPTTKAPVVTSTATPTTAPSDTPTATPTAIPTDTPTATPTTAASAMPTASPTSTQIIPDSTIALDEPKATPSGVSDSNVRATPNPTVDTASPTESTTTTAPTPVPTPRPTTQRPNPFPVPFLDPDGHYVTEEPTYHPTEAESESEEEIEFVCPICDDENEIVTNPDAVIFVPVLGQKTCQELFVEASKGRIEEGSQCDSVLLLASSVCSCADATSSPSESPSEATSSPSVTPSNSPSNLPSMMPSDSRSNQPTLEPSDSPSQPPSMTPTNDPTNTPSAIPTISFRPTVTPLTCEAIQEANEANDESKLVSVNITFFFQDTVSARSVGWSVTDPDYKCFRVGVPPGTYTEKSVVEALRLVEGVNYKFALEIDSFDLPSGLYNVTSNNTTLAHNRGLLHSEEGIIFKTPWN